MGFIPNGSNQNKQICLHEKDKFLFFFPNSHLLLIFTNIQDMRTRAPRIYVTSQPVSTVL